MISKRCLSSNYPDYSRSDGKVIEKLTPPKSPEGVLVGGTYFESIGKAAEQSAALAVLLLQVSLAVVAVVKVSEAWSMTAYCSDVCKILPAFLLTI